MRQYYAFKEKHPECILFFRMGDFYEMFDDDAVTAHKALGITLTERTKGVPMAGVPYHAVDGYLRKMIELGFRVAVCEQVEDPKEAKGVVDRAVTRVLTPGTLVDENLLDETAANTLAAIMFTESGDDSAAVAAIVELSTGAFSLHDLASGRAADELARLAPSEIVYVETADGNVPPRVAKLKESFGCALTARPGWTFRSAEALEALRTHFGVRSMSGFGLDDDDPALAPAGALLRYLHETQGGASDGAAPLLHVRPPKREPNDNFIIIDATSLRSLEIERTLRSGSAEGSLLHTLQRCRSPMGKRLLRMWLCFPLRDVARIHARQRAIGAMVEDPDFADALADRIGRVQDVARIASRIAMRRATPRDLSALGRSTGEIERIVDLLEQRPAFAAVRERLGRLTESLGPLAQRIADMCIDAPPAHLREGGLFRDGIDRQLDEARSLQRDGNAFLAQYQKELIEETGINTLKVGYNRVFGYYIEISRAAASRAPESFTRKQTLKNAERYITPKLKDFEEKITTAEQRAIEREQILFEKLCAEAAGQIDALSDYAELVATLDVLTCFAENARRYGFVRPEIVEDPVISVEQGRHPVLDRIIAESFVPNDCEIGGSATLALITGPNMAGKSTYIRQVALIALLAHTGSFVPAERATIGIIDRIFTRIGAQDELHAGQSTFMVEMTETANILHHATDRSLVILDEIGRGTSTLDGLSLAWAIAETLSARRCRTLFATHYHELTSLAESLENVTNLHVSVREWGSPGNEEIIFLYRILPGRTDRSYGIHVAKIAGIPPATIERARELLDTITVKTEHEMPAEVRQSSRRDDSTTRQMSLFTEYLDHPAVEELRRMELDRMSPLEAFDALRRLREQVDSGSPNGG